jgi:CrcB protein
MTLNWKTMALVFAGGTLGTLVRAEISSTLAGLISLAVVNIIGSAIIGWLNGDPRFATVGKRAFWAVGFAGGFTTMSGVALFLVLGAALAPFAILLVLAIFALSLLAYWGAHALTSRLTGNDAAVSHDVEEVTE